MDETWNALSDSTRREILEMLKNRPHTAGEIADQFSLSASTVSHHLCVLKMGGLVRVNRRAQTIIYSLNEPAFQELIREISSYLN